VATLTVILGSIWTSLASGAPQWTGSLRPGLAGVGDRSSLWQTTEFYGAAYGDVVFGRTRFDELGVGPYLDCSTVAFSDLRLSSGPTVLIPISSLVTQLSIGPYLALDSRTRTGLHSQLFVGGRSYNHYGAYSSAIGLVLGLDYGLSGQHETVLTSALVLDAQYLALPFLLLYGALQPSP
jgi:hypothetical protein